MPATDQLPLVGEGPYEAIAPSGALAVSSTCATAAELTGDPFIDNFPYPPDNLLYDDGVPLESNWHASQIPFLIEMIHWHRRGRRDFFAGGNMFVYYNVEQTRTLDYRGPDFFLVNQAAHRPERKYWAIWDEGGRYPDLIIELMSPTTKKIDLKTKFDIYEQVFATREYVAYDPATREINAWRKNEDGKFRPIVPDEHGRVFLVMAGLSLGTWFGARFLYETTWLRFFDADGNAVLTAGEGQAARADSETVRADAETARADALAAEVARLKALLANPS